MRFQPSFCRVFWPVLTAVIFFISAMGSYGMAELSKEFQAYMIQHHYGVVALDSSDRDVNQQTVDVKINGKNVTLGLDTGCSRTVLNESCARRLGLNVVDTGQTISGIGGAADGHAGIAQVKSFTIGNCEINRLSTIHVLPKSGHAGPLIDGLLGLDYLRLNAAIIPVAGSGFLIKPGPVPPVSVRSYLVKLGYTPVALTSEPRQPLLVLAHLNGHALKVMIDSGAAFSTFDAGSVAAALGHTVTSAPVTMEGIDGRHPETYRFSPAKFDLGGFSIPPLTMLALHSPVFQDDQVEGLVGVDVMGLHRGIIDLGENLLWLK